MTRRKPLTLNAGKVEQLPDNGAIAGVATVRQTVLNGSTDSSGFPNALSAGAGLAVTLTATGTAFLLSFAAGFDANGNIDYLGQFTANQSFSSLTASTTNYLYVDRDSTTGALTTGFSTLLPVYQTIAPTSPATGQHWFDLNAFTMKRWSGSAWVVFQRVFVGEAIAGASTITTTVNYALRGAYQSVWTAVAATTIYSFNHNLGISLSANTNIQVFTSVAGSDSDSVIATPSTTFWNGSVNQTYGWLPRVTTTPHKTFSLLTRDFPALNNTNNFVATGNYKVCVNRGW